MPQKEALGDGLRQQKREDAVLVEVDDMFEATESTIKFLDDGEPGTGEESDGGGTSRGQRTNGAYVDDATIDRG